MARQFIVKENEIVEKENNVFEIVSSEVKHIQVLRYNIGDSIVINSKVYEILKMTRNSITVKYLYENQYDRTEEIEVTLYIAFLKNEMMDYSIKKAVELGARRIVPFLSNNVVVKLDEKDLAKKKEKFTKIAIEAVKQCGRYDIPIIENIVKLDSLEEVVKENDVNIFAYEKESIGLKQTISKIKEDKKEIKKVGIIIGPEGGFTEAEYEKIKKFENVYSVSLGKRILRAETATISTISIIMYEFS